MDQFLCLNANRKGMLRDATDVWIGVNLINLRLPAYQAEVCAAILNFSGFERSSDSLAVTIGSSNLVFVADPKLLVLDTQFVRMR